ncbi:MAG: hypothetical protein RL748_2851 [Pseudomonadota bacterium]
MFKQPQPSLASTTILPRSSKKISAKISLTFAITLFASTFTMASNSTGENVMLGAKHALQQHSLVERAPSTPHLGPHATERLLYWMNVALGANALDHTPNGTGIPEHTQHQGGPHRSSRALAIVSIGMFEAVNTIVGGYQSYVGHLGTPKKTSIDAAIAQSAHDTLVALYPSQAPIFDAALTADLANIVTKNPAQKTNGIDLGKRAAAAILAARANDNIPLSEQVVGTDYIPGTNPGDWNQDPIAQQALAVGALWGSVKPFVLRSGSQFRLPAPPALSSPAYASAYAEVKDKGAKGDTASPTTRTADQTQAAIFWGYDGSAKLGTPPRMFNQFIIQIAEQMGTYHVNDLARLFALANTAMADAGIAAWETKYAYKHWRPVGGIRAGELDGNGNTTGQASWEPLGAPATNLSGPNFTPPFPAYPSGHSTFGSALFQTLRNVYGTDDMEFSLVSDEYNGVNKDNQGNVRPAVVRSYSSFSEAEEENGQSRIWLGVHWAYDKTGGAIMGRQLADYIYHRAFRRTQDR